MENLLNKNLDFSNIQIHGLLSVVDIVLEKNKKNSKLLCDLKTFFTNFGLSFKDKSYTEILLTNEYNKKIIISIINSLEATLKYYHDNSVKLKSDEKGEVDLNNKYTIHYVIETIFLIYDVYENIKDSDVGSLIGGEQEKNFKIFFLEFEKYFGVLLEKYKENFYKKIGYLFCDFKGNILNHENYVSNQILETADLNGKNIFDFICSYSQVILKEIFGSNILDFRENKDQVKFAFTVNIDKSPINCFTDECKENKIINHFNSIKTLSCRASIVIDCNKNESLNLIPCVMLEIRNSTFRQNFDEFIWKTS